VKFSYNSSLVIFKIAGAAGLSLQAIEYVKRREKARGKRGKEVGHRADRGHVEIGM